MRQAGESDLSCHPPWVEAGMAGGSCEEMLLIGDSGGEKGNNGSLHVDNGAELFRTKLNFKVGFYHLISCALLGG